LKPKSSIIKLALSFIIPFVALLFLIPKFFNLELDGSGIMMLAVGAFGIFLLVQLYRRSGHQGHLPLFLGTALLFLSGLALLSSVSLNGSGAILELSARSQGFSMMGMAVGFILLLVGGRSAMSASYFWGSRRR
jgi:hypothetical protein